MRKEALHVIANDALLHEHFKIDSTPMELYVRDTLVRSVVFTEDMVDASLAERLIKDSDASINVAPIRENPARSIDCDTFGLSLLSTTSDPKYMVFFSGIDSATYHKLYIFTAMVLLNRTRDLVDPLNSNIVSRRAHYVFAMRPDGYLLFVNRALVGSNIISPKGSHEQ